MDLVVSNPLVFYQRLWLLAVICGNSDTGSYQSVPSALTITWLLAVSSSSITDRAGFKGFVGPRHF
jgi:hypothetical protein